MTRQILLGLSCAAAFCLCSLGTALAVTPIKCPSQPELQQRDAYLKLIPQYRKDPRLQTQVQLMQRYIDDINARQTNCKTPPKPVVPKEDPCTKTRNDIAAKSKAGRNAALAYVSRTRPGKNGYYVRYNHPPIYCGGTWTAAARPYYMKTFETVREITRLSNNGNQITAIGTW